MLITLCREEGRAPVVRQSTQVFWHHNFASYEPGASHGWLAGVKAAKVDMIESQAAVLGRAEWAHTPLTPAHHTDTLYMVHL